MGDAGLGEVLIDGELGGHDDVVSRGEDGVHTVGDQRGSGSDDFVVRVCGLLNVLDALGVEVGLRVGDGLGGVGLREGVEQANLGDVRVLGEHHVHDEAGVQRVARAGHIVDARQARGLGIGDGGINNGGLGVLSGEGRDLRGGRRDGDDGVDLIGDRLIGQLL